MHGNPELNKHLRRDHMAIFFVNLPPCLIDIECCWSAHHAAAELLTFGRSVRAMAPQFLKRYVKTANNDAADAEAICEAAGRPNMRYVTNA